MSRHCKSGQRHKVNKRDATWKGYSAPSFMNECGEIVNATAGLIH